MIEPDLYFWTNLVDKLSVKEKSINQLWSLGDVTIHRESI